MKTRHKFLKIIWKLIETPYKFIISTIAYYTLKREKREKHYDAIFILSCSFGDVVFGMAYLKAYKAKNRRRILLISDEKTKSIIDAYNNYDGVQYYDRTKKWGKWYLRILNASKFYYETGLKDNIYNTVPWVKHGLKNGTCLEKLSQDLLLCNGDTEIDYPNPQSVEVISIKDFNINKNKIAIINPYAHSNNTCECRKELEEIRDILQKNGYIIYCNIIKFQDAIDNTIPLECSISEFYSIANAVPLIVSVRTGILDWTVNTLSKKIVLCPEQNDFYRFYAMSQWKQNNILEITLPNPDLISLIKDFIN